MLNGIHGHQDIERVVYGKPAGAALRAEAERLGAKRVFITTTRSVAQSALLADVIRDLGDRYAGVYAGITAHSPRPCVIEGAALARDAKADLIVAVGGGSAIDATKVMLIALWQNATRIEDLDLYRAGKPKEGAAPPAESIRPPASAIRMLAVPTTLSAAEFNAFAGITDPRSRHQGELRPSPGRAARHRARSGRDARHADGPHAFDRPESGRPRRRAAVLAAGQPLCHWHFDRSAAVVVACAARRTRPSLRTWKRGSTCQFGMWLSIGAGTSGVGVGASHGIGHVLGAACAVPHGHTSCVMLPSVLRWNLPANAERQKRVSEAFRKPEVAAADLVAGLVRSLGLPGRLGEVGRGQGPLPRDRREVDARSRRAEQSETDQGAGRSHGDSRTGGLVGN